MAHTSNLWGASGTSCIYVEQDGWRKQLFREVSTLAGLAPDHDRGMSGRDGI
jgi:hypothetical protein